MTGPRKRAARALKDATRADRFAGVWGAVLVAALACVTSGAIGTKSGKPFAATAGDTVPSRAGNSAQAATATKRARAKRMNSVQLGHRDHMRARDGEQGGADGAFQLNACFVKWDMARKTGSHGDITGPKVREAALKLIARHGYAAVSMRQIAREVGVQVGALYRYTPDKQTLLFELMRGHMDTLLEARAAASTPDNALLKLDHFTRFHIRFHHERPDTVLVAYMELRNLTEENFTKVERLRRQYENVLGDILERGVAQGAFVIEDTKITTLAIIAMLTGLTTWYRDGGRLALAEIEQIYITMVRGMVGVT